MNITSPSKAPAETEDNKKQNKNFKALFISLAVAVILLITLGSFFFFKAPTSTEELKDKANNSSETNEDIQFSITDFIVEKTPENEFVYSFNIHGLEPNSMLEFTIQDKGRQIVAKKIIEGKDLNGETTFTGKLNVEDVSDRFSLKARNFTAESDGQWKTIAYYDYDNGSTKPVSESDIPKYDNVNPAFYETPWAQRTEISAQALSDAVSIAYGVAELEPQEFGNCYLLTEAYVKAGELLPPKMSSSGEKAELRFSIESYINDDSFYFAWVTCEI